MKIDKLTIASELIIEAIEMKGKRPTQLNFEELIDVVESVVKKLTITDVSQQSEQLFCKCGSVKNGGYGCMRTDCDNTLQAFMQNNCG